MAPSSVDEGPATLQHSGAQLAGRQNWSSAAELKGRQAQVVAAEKPVIWLGTAALLEGGLKAGTSSAAVGSLACLGGRGLLGDCLVVQVAEHQSGAESWLHNKHEPLLPQDQMLCQVLHRGCLVVDASSC